jgi:DNA-binding MarR family transcriptional regulator
LKDLSLDIFRLMRIQARAWTAMELELRKKGVLPIVVLEALEKLSRGPVSGLKQRDLEQRLLLRQYEISRLIENLVERGLATRTDNLFDRRSRLIKITKAGIAVRDMMQGMYGAEIEKIAGARISESEASALREILEHLDIRQVVSEVGSTLKMYV